MADTPCDKSPCIPVAGAARRSRRFPVDDLLALMTHRDPSVRAGALTVLGRHMRTDARVISILVDTLRGEDSSAIRVQAVEKLGELGDVTVVPTLKEIARAEGEPKLRRAIAFAVASIENRNCGS